ncbi:hypothetical protein N431DRAFT_473715 [Stipitochalara longipes BDJ]|nr:hypothetical protein N431DRAFT_473715 [Stipitochalara longipes BDJ]
MAEGVTIAHANFELARKAEEWSKTLRIGGIYAEGDKQPSLPASPPNTIEPILVDIANFLLSPAARPRLALALRTLYCHTFPASKLRHRLRTKTANLGGKVGFVADKHRIAVILTRQSQFLMIFGDSKCTLVGKDPAAKEQAPVSIGIRGTPVVFNVP